MGTDPSAAAGPYGTGGILRAAACFVFAGGPYAINPERSESSGLVAPSQAADACIATYRLQKAYETPAAGTLFGEEPVFRRLPASMREKSKSGTLSIHRFSLL